VGSNPPLRRPFFRYHLFASNPGAKIKWKFTWHCCICCNPAKGRVEFEDGWLIKSSFITKDTRTKFQKKKKKKDILFGKIRINYSVIFYDLHLISNDGFMIAVKEKRKERK
jgi:hypothetical protein